MSKTISIIIVNYNVKDLLKECIDSIYRSVYNGKIEIIVVDNNSKDNSIKFLSNIFKDVIFIQNQENLGFSKANNIGFEKASGDYLLILNPDTIIQPDTLQKMSDLLDENPKIGMAGCKVLNSDGSFQLACRRSFPTPWNSFCKLFGLQKIFPRSKLFAAYNLTYKDIDKQYEVDALIGAFMFTRKEVIEKVQGFDEDFFMYGEDLDLCFKIKKHGWKIVYSPITKITHSKGESTKRSNIDDVKHFYDAMKIYIRKNYKFSIFFIGFLSIGINIRSLLSYLFKFKRDFLYIFLDLILIITSFLISNKIRFDSIYGYPPENLWLFVGIIASVNFLSNFTSGSYFENNYSIKKLFESILILGIATGFITYLFREIDLSRKVLLLTGIIYFAIGSVIRFIIEKRKNLKNARNVLLIGENDLSNKIYNFLKNNRSADIANVNILDANINNDLTVTEKLIDENNIQEVIICGDDLQLSEIKLFLKDRTLEKINLYHPKNFEEFQTRTLLEKAFGSHIPNKSRLSFPRFKFFKRTIDVLISTFFLTLGLPLVYLINNSKISPINGMLNVLFGRWSLIGLKNKQPEDSFKEGYLSLADISGGKSQKTVSNLNEYYLNNYSVGLDLDIFFRSFGKKG